jgi:protein-disulfide isomerase
MLSGCAARSQEEQQIVVAPTHPATASPTATSPPTASPLATRPATATATPAQSTPDTPAATPTSKTPPTSAATAASETNEPTPSPTQQEYIISQTRHFKGDPDAPVTIIEFSDFQCPYCSKFSMQTLPKIEEKYVQQGIVRLGYRHAAFQGEGSVLAAAASECAADQDAFWEYHDRLVERLAVEQKRDFTPETLNMFAEELNLDTETFRTCLEEGPYIDLVQRETRDIQSIGITGTPTFLINGRRLVGAQPLAAFEQAIQTARQGEPPTPAEEPAAEADSGTEGESDGEMTTEEAMAMLEGQARHFKGDPDAPVTIIEFSDFLCPYCGKFAFEAGQQIDETYIQEGIVRLGYIHAAYHGEEAFLVAEASECAADQDAFWEYHDQVFQRLVRQNQHDFPPDVLSEIAADVQLDTDAFNTCLEDGTHADLVRIQTEFSQNIGVTGTPTFVLNGMGIVGAQPFEVFQRAIESER